METLEILGLQFEHAQALQRLSQSNHRKAWKFFYPEGKGRPKPGYCLHHVDCNLRHSNIERYVEWNPQDLVMLTKSEHSSLHHALGHIRMSPEGRERMRAANMGNTHASGSHKISEDGWRRMSEAHKNHVDSEEIRLKKRANARRGEDHYMFGKHWWTNSETGQVAKAKENPGEGWIPGFTLRPKTDEEKAVLSAYKRDCRHWTNGAERRFCKECPGEGWRPGRLWHRPHDEAEKAHLSECAIGRKWWNDGETCRFSRECPGPGWTRGASFWWNNGEEQRRCPECPGEGWSRGMLNNK